MHIEHCIKNDELSVACRVLDMIEATTKKNEKKALLEQHKDNEALQWILKNALDWFIHFGLGNPPKKFREDIVVDEYAGFNEIRLYAETYKGISLWEIYNQYPEWSKWLHRMIMKDLKAGIDTTVDKVWPGLVNKFEVMLAETFEDQKDIADWYPCTLETKIDGLRCVAFVDTVKNEVQYISRGGQSLLASEIITEELLKLAKKLGSTGCVFDGELFCDSFNKTMTMCRRDDYESKYEDDRNNILYYCFDVMDRGEWIAQQPYSYITRIQRLDLGLMASNLNRVVRPMNTIANNFDDVNRFYQENLNIGAEGIMIKNHKTLYEWDRSKGLLKYKPVFTVDVPVVGVYNGDAKSKYKNTLGGFTVAYGFKETNVGGGFSDEQRNDFWLNRDAMIGKIIEVEYKGLTPDGKLREPVFVRVREDKTNE
jgi:ATP-dependent DNA ligase